MSAPNLHDLLDLHPFRESLRGWWIALPQHRGLTWWDASGRGNHGTLTNMDPATDWQHSDTLTGTWGRLDFLAGSSQAVNMGAWNGGSSLTLIARIRFNATAGSNEQIIACDESAGGDRVFQFRRSSGRLQFIGFSGGSPNTTTATSAGTLVNGIWYTVGVTQNTSAVRLFVDGSENNSGSGYALDTGNDIWGFAARFNGGDFNNEPATISISEVQRYERALTPAEVRHLYDLSRRHYGWYDRLTVGRNRPAVFEQAESSVVVPPHLFLGGCL